VRHNQRLNVPLQGGNSAPKPQMSALKVLHTALEVPNACPPQKIDA
jgi:hypothetical protein